MAKSNTIMTLLLSIARSYMGKMSTTMAFSKKS
jgi:hypothetical protein